MNALRSLALHDSSLEDAYKILVYVLKCPERVKSSDQTMNNEKTRREKTTTTKQTHSSSRSTNSRNKKVLTVLTDTNYKIVCFIELSPFEIAPIRKQQNYLNVKRNASNK